MNYLTKNLLKISSAIGICFIGSLFDTNSNVLANTCNANNPSSLSDSCYITPSTYKIEVYEMGLCTSDPLAGTYIDNSDNVISDIAIDESTCTKTFESLTGSLVDLGGNSTQSLTGTNFRPPAGTYPSAYIKIKNNFILKGTYRLNGTDYYSQAYVGNNNVTTTESANAEFSEDLFDFGNGRSCNSTESNREMAAADVFNSGITGTMKAVLATVSGGNYTGTTKANCANSTRIFGVFNPTNPVVITDSTQGLEVTFSITNKGITIIPNGSGNVVNNFSSGPFSPSFETF